MRLVTVLALALRFAAAQEVDSDREPPDLQARRAEYFQRFHGPAEERVKAWQARRQMRTLSFRGVEAANSPKASADQWTSIGPRPLLNPLSGPQGGRINSIAIDPRDGRVMFIATPNAGVWRTRDGGTNWTPVTDNQASPAIGALALDPTNPDTVYAGTGDPIGFSGAGILKSTDGGNTWTLTAQPFATGYGGHRIASIAVSPTNGQIVLAAVAPPASGLVSVGIYRSTDGGATWRSALVGPLGYQVIFHPTDGNIAWATLGPDPNPASNPPRTGILKSTDAGATWTPINGSGPGALPVSTAFFFRLAVAPSAPNTMYASLASSTSNPAGIIGMYKSTDGGGTWSPLAAVPNYCTTQCGYDNVIAVHPTNPNAVFLGGIREYRSLDGGATWRDVTIGYVDTHAIAFTPNAATMIYGNDGGVWAQSSPLAATLPAGVSLNNTLSVTQFYPGISIHPTNLNLGYGGAQDTGPHQYTGQQAWPTFGALFGGGCGDAGATAFDYKTPSTIYLTCIGNIIFKSVDSGANWRHFVNGITAGDRGQFLAPIVLDPVNPLRLYYATYRMYQTSDGAANWTPISGDLTGGRGVIDDFGVAPSDPNTIWTVSSDNRVFVTNNAGSGAGAVWNDRSAGLPAATLNAIAVDARNPLTAFVANVAFGFNPVYRTTDGGKTWTNASGALPKIGVRSLLCDPDLSGTVYAGTELGVYFTTDNGATWNPLGSGMPFVAVTGMTIHRATRTLRAGTFGRGMWDLAVPLPPVPVAAAAGVTNGASFAAGPVAPGEIFTIFGASMGPASLTSGTITGGVVDPAVAAVRVLFDGVPAPLLYVSAGQTAGVVPYAVDGKSATQLVVEYRGQQSAAVSVPVAASSPAIFRISAAGQGAILNQDNSVNGPDNPAAVGSYIVIFATGEGQTDPAGVDGRIATTVFPKPKLPVTLTIGGVDTPVLYGGAAPSAVAGAFQVNVQIPAGVVPGAAVPVVLKVGAVSSPVVYLAVK
jgi:uncharacterized protein (TIGR03437 family)